MKKSMKNILIMVGSIVGMRISNIITKIIISLKILIKILIFYQNFIKKKKRNEKGLVLCEGRAIWGKKGIKHILALKCHGVKELLSWKEFLRSVLKISILCPMWVSDQPSSSLFLRSLPKQSLLSLGKDRFFY